MNARRLILATLVWLCTSIGALCALSASALALPPEAPVTEVAVVIQNTTAEVTGMPNPHTVAPENSSWHFEYNEGATCTGGQTTSGLQTELSFEHNPVGGVVGVELTGLKPGVKYTFCMIAETQAKEIAVGGPKSFTTTTTRRFGSRGNESGEVEGVSGLAVDQATGDVYVGDTYNARVDVFDGSGNFRMAWGWDVNAASPVEGLQTCTTRCQKGISGRGAGQFGGEGAMGVAVDNELGSVSYGDVYVVDFANFRVQEFNSSGEFLAMFGGEVNTAKDGVPGATRAEKDLCVAGETCQEGTEGTADGEFEWSNSGDYIAVGPGGRVYVGDRARVQVFEPSGAWRESISLSGLSNTAQVSALAVNSSGDMFVKDGVSEANGAVAGVREFEPDGTEVATQFDAGSTTIAGLVVGESGDLFVGDASGGFHVLVYGPAGNQLASFGAKAVIEDLSGAMALSGTLGELYVGNYVKYSSGEEQANVSILSAPTAGPPTTETGNVRVVPGRRGAASLEAAFDPGGFESKYHFEYVSQTDFQASGYADASSTAEGTVSATLEEQSVSAALTGLVPGETYHYRFVATNSKGTVASPGQSFEEVPPALVKGPWVTDVSSTSVTFGAEVDALGVSTEYKLEYGTSASYGKSVTGNVGEGEGYVPLGFHRQELLPGTVYHYRIVTYNEVGTVEGADHTFTTQAVGGQELTLPDGRAWELVSPPNKKGSLIAPFNEGLIQAAADGSGISYLSLEAVGDGVAGKASATAQILSVRVGAGWGTRDVEVPHRLVSEGEPPSDMLNANNEYVLFSTDLSQAMVEPVGVTPPLSPGLSERSLYLRDDADGDYLPFVSSENVPAGVRFGGPNQGEGEANMQLLDATPDLSHVVLESPYPLTRESTVPGEACPVALIEGFCDAPTKDSAPWNLYEWSAGRLRLVDILPGGEPLQVSYAGKYSSAFIGVDENGESSMVARSVSSDGRWIVWGTASSKDGHVHMYVRDMVGERTYPLGGPDPVFQTMSADGSKVFFSENGDLYVFDTATGTQTDLTVVHGAGESSAGVQDHVLGAGEGGASVYFVATGVLASGGVSGEDNVYMLSEEAGVWRTRYVATLSGEDDPNWLSTECGAGVGSCHSSGGTAVELGRVTARVSPDGRYLEFMSDRPLTGYDNHDARSGQPDEEVYLYDGENDRLVCASCDPSGARPVGLFDDRASNGAEVPLVDAAKAWQAHWLAGSVPGWSGAYPFHERSEYQPRFLSDSGRLFFDSPDALVPQASNGLEDVYEYEPAGVGGCEDTSVAFSERSDGCVSLVSAGTSSSESAFLDASENGDDVFFVTASKLVSTDYDNSYDVYDAHVCSVEVPCVAEPSVPPACTTEASCRPAPTPQPEIFGPAPSATFSGTGNLTAEATSAVKAKKALAKPKKKAKSKKPKKKLSKRKAGRAGGARKSGRGKASEKGAR